MFRRVINSNNFDQTLAEIKVSSDTLFDFSGTNFRELGPQKLSNIFIALYSLPQAFSLKLNNCKIDEENWEGRCQLGELTLGLSAAQNMRAFEFVRSLSLNCPDAILLKIAESLLRNHQIESIKIDGFKVTPPAVCEILKNHPTALLVFVDGLPKLNKHGFFKSASNESVANDPNHSARFIQYKRSRS